MSDLRKQEDPKHLGDLRRGNRKEKSRRRQITCVEVGVTRHGRISYGWGVGINGTPRFGVGRYPAAAGRRPAQGVGRYPRAEGVSDRYTAVTRPLQLLLAAS